MGVPVRVVDADGLSAWWDRSAVPLGVSIADYAMRKVAELGATAFRWNPDSPRFSWICPGCGMLSGGELGDEPVSGWDNPRWVNTGTREKPTLTPSLGCPLWRRGMCDNGHWWLRDGVLEPA